MRKRQAPMSRLAVPDTRVSEAPEESRTIIKTGEIYRHADRGAVTANLDVCRRHRVDRFDPEHPRAVRREIVALRQTLAALISEASVSSRSASSAAASPASMAARSAASASVIASISGECRVFISPLSHGRAHPRISEAEPLPEFVGAERRSLLRLRRAVPRA